MSGSEGGGGGWGRGDGGFTVDRNNTRNLGVFIKYLGYSGPRFYPEFDVLTGNEQEGRGGGWWCSLYLEETGHETVQIQKQVDLSQTEDKDISISIRVYGRVSEEIREVVWSK